MNRADKQRSNAASSRLPPARPMSAQHMESEQPIGIEKLRMVNASIGSDVLKQIAARTNNAEEEDSALYKKRAVCNYCLIKSKHNLKGKCLECTIPST